MDRLGFWGTRNTYNSNEELAFQYPLMDRLGFWGDVVFDVQDEQSTYFSIR